MTVKFDIVLEVVKVHVRE